MSSQVEVLLTQDRNMLENILHHLLSVHVEEIIGKVNWLKNAFNQWGIEKT